MCSVDVILFYNYGSIIINCSVWFDIDNLFTIPDHNVIYCKVKIQTLCSVDVPLTAAYRVLCHVTGMSSDKDEIIRISRLGRILLPNNATVRHN